MKISNPMIKFYLDHIIQVYFVDHHEMPEDLGEFDSCIETARRSALATGELPWLFLGLQHLINDPQVDLSSYSRGGFPLEATDVRDIIVHTLNVLNAPGGISPPVIPITLDNMTGEDWAAYRAEWDTPS